MLSFTPVMIMAVSQYTGVILYWDQVTSVSSKAETVKVPNTNREKYRNLQKQLTGHTVYYIILLAL